MIETDSQKSTGEKEDKKSQDEYEFVDIDDGKASHQKKPVRRDYKWLTAHVSLTTLPRDQTSDWF